MSVVGGEVSADVVTRSAGDGGVDGATHGIGELHAGIVRPPIRAHHINRVAEVPDDAFLGGPYRRYWSDIGVRDVFLGVAVPFPGGGGLRPEHCRKPKYKISHLHIKIKQKSFYSLAPCLGC